MAKGFYLKLAFANIKRSKAIYLPYAIATAIISGVYFLVNMLRYSPGISGVPSGEAAQAVFMFTSVFISLFTFIFMMYINNFLIKRRKKEFGLYGVLGLEKRHVGRVLLYENFFVMAAGVLVGVALALIFGRLLFMVLANMIELAGENTFIVPTEAFSSVGILFAVVFLATSLMNLLSVRLANPIELLRSDKSGEKRKSTAVVPLTVIGSVIMAAAYWIAAGTQMPAVALMTYFPAAILVIIGTYMLFTSGSIVFLRALRRNKKIYYKPDNFVSISGMLHRMRQNAVGLATICIVSTMLIVTVAITTSLYFGQEETLRVQQPYDISVAVDSEEQAGKLDELVGEVAKKKGIYTLKDTSKIVPEDNQLSDLGMRKYNMAKPGQQPKELKHSLYMNEKVFFDLSGGDRDGYIAFRDALADEIADAGLMIKDYAVDSYHLAAKQAYGLFGGLIFMGVFLGVVFLAVTVLIIYFKQISEGYEDRERFVILKKVGMDDSLVRRTISAQVKWVFFLPLLAALVHTVFSTIMTVTMLKSFGMMNPSITISCAAITFAIFAVVYIIVYRLTARTYYGIVNK